MKHNKILLLAVMLFAMFALCGCMDIKDMTEEEADMVAEYSAGVLLRYSDTYPLRLITKEQRKSDGQTATTAPSATPAVTAEATAPVEQEADGNTGTVSGSTVDTNPVQSSGPAVQEVPLKDIYGMEDVKVEFKDIRTCRKYKNIQASAADGETLVVVSFELRNTSSKEKRVNLMKREIDYPLEIDGETYQLGINLLKGNDLKYLNISIGPGKKENAVLIYNVPKTAVKKGVQATVSVQETKANKRAVCRAAID